MVILGLAMALAVGGLDARPAPPSADSARVVGRVLDGSTGRGLEGVQIRLLTPSDVGPERVVWGGSTDGSGGFITGRLPTGRLELRAEALGYGPATTTLELLGGMVLDVRVELAPEPLELEPLVVVSRRESRLEAVGFYERRRAGQGYSLTREEIAQGAAARPSDLFRRIPGVQMEAQRRGTASLLRFRGCYPDMLLDGVPLQGPVAVDQILSVEQIEAVEVHSGAYVPARARVGTCGTVMVWTRSGSRAEPGQGMTRGRLLTAGVIVLVAFLLVR